MTETLKTQKDNLAKLMAGENLTIVHRRTPTAYFDLKNRLLCCPIFKDDISAELYDLFMGHEVGHALWTPFEGVHSAVTKNRTLKGYLNVVEDVRIEKNIRNKYQGLRRSFFTAYNELMEMDFFGVKGKDLNKELSLIDKINLITKCGSRIQINLSKEEQVFLDWAERCETWEEVEECATAIYEWSKENETRTEVDESLVPQMFDIGDEEEGEDEEDDMEELSWGESEESEEEGDGAKGDEGEELEEEKDSLPDLDEEKTEDSTGDGKESEEEAEDESDDKKTTGGETSTGRPEEYDDEDGARESITEHNAHNNEEKFVSDTNIVKTQIKLKEKNFDKFTKEIVYPYKNVINDFKVYFEQARYNDYYKKKVDGSIRRAAHSMKKLESKNKAIVNHMAKEFEMKQTALASRHAFTGKTGKLDMNRLAKYQIVEDVFKRVTYLPDGKNHGVNILLDWSGSISREVRDLMEQSVILTMFCRKVGIPHRVYLFSDAMPETDDDDYYRHNKAKLIEIFSNEMNSKEYKANFQNMMSIWNNYFSERMGWSGRHLEKNIENWNNWFDQEEPLVNEGGWVEFPEDIYPENKYRLGGTPLDAGLVAMRGLLPKFNKAYGVEKSILTVITDGYSHTADILNMSEEEAADQKEQLVGEEREWDVAKCREIIDPINGRVYDYKPNSRYGGGDFKSTQNLLDWLTQTTGVTVTGYFVCGKKADLSNLLYTLNEDIGYVPSEKVDSMWREARKEGVVVEAKGYNKLFMTAASALGTDGEDTLDDELIGGKKSTIMSRFKKNQRAKSTSRFLTNEFIKEIA